MNYTIDTCSLEKANIQATTNTAYGIALKWKHDLGVIEVSLSSPERERNRLFGIVTHPNKDVIWLEKMEERWFKPCPYLCPLGRGVLGKSTK